MAENYQSLRAAAAARAAANQGAATPPAAPPAASEPAAIGQPSGAPNMQPPAMPVARSGSWASGGSTVDAQLAQAEALQDEVERARRDWKANGVKLGFGNARAAGAEVRWIPDEEVLACPLCATAFDWATRRHHCRHCGGVFCGDCSSRRMLLENAVMPAGSTTSAHDPQRVCDPCATQVEHIQPELRANVSNAVRTNTVERDGVRKYFNSPLAFTLGHEIRKASYTLSNLTTLEQGMSPNAIPDQSIPTNILRAARGLAFLTVIKGGFVWTGRLGTGLVVARLDGGGWSAPTAIGTAGMGWGAAIGGEVTDYVIVLNSPGAVQAFGGRGQLALGAEISVAAGPVGRTAAGTLNAGDGGVAAVYTYAHSKGLFAGVSLQGAIVAARTDVNETFYGTRIDPLDLLNGSVPPPKAAQPLYEILESVIGP